MAQAEAANEDARNVRLCILLSRLAYGSRQCDSMSLRLKPTEYTMHAGPTYPKDPFKTVRRSFHGRPLPALRRIGSGMRLSRIAH